MLSNILPLYAKKLLKEEVAGFTKASVATKLTKVFQHESYTIKMSISHFTKDWILELGEEMQVEFPFIGNCLCLPFYIRDVAFTSSLGFKADLKSILLQKT